MAHHDDDLLFLNPDVSTVIRGGGCVRTVFVVASDYHAKDREPYMLARETGVRAAYARMAGLPESAWTVRQVTVGRHRVEQWSLGERVSLVELRLPDNASTYRDISKESMRRLYARQATLPDFYRHNRYDRPGLVALLAALIDDFHPRLVRTLDPDAKGKEYIDFHHDHVVTAHLTTEAVAASRLRPPMRYYRDYLNRYAAPNLTPEVAADKLATFRTFARHDEDICPTPDCVTRGFYYDLTKTQYTASPPQLATGRP